MSQHSEQRRTRNAGRAWAVSLVVMAAIVGLAGCDPTEPETASIAFQTDAPFCGSMRVERRIDGVVVASDTLYHAVKSSPITVSAGSHTVSAKMIYFDGHGTIYTWPDTTYLLARGDTVTRVLALYCS